MTTKAQIKQFIDNQGGTRGNRHGLLCEFIMEKLYSYTPPTRRGTPRGDSIGFPGDKHMAVLFSALTGVTLKKLAQQFKISYGALRNWSTEPEFKQQKLKFQDEFTERFIAHMRNQYRESCKRRNEHREGEVQKVLNRPDTEEQQQKDLEELGLQDNWLYGPDLLAGINNRIQAETSGSEGVALTFWFNVMSVLVSSAEHRFLPLASPQTKARVWKLQREILRDFGLVRLRQIRSILQSPEKATPENRQLAVHALDQVGQCLEKLAVENDPNQVTA